MACLGQDRERPRRARPERERRRAVAGDGHAAGILQHLLGAGDVGAERLGRQRIDALVAEPVARELMAGRDDAAHEGSVPLGDPAEREEGADDAGARAQLQQPLGVGFHPSRQLVPGAAGDHIGERLDVEKILHVHGQRIDRVFAGAGRRHGVGRGHVDAGHRCPAP